MILQRIRDSYVAKGMAVYLAFSIIFQITYPTASYALTGGPSQPEVQSFSPVGVSDMVDLSSGDFHYNIPLIDVGGYPINMVYNSGITMDQEASWVGLGWNINPGVINRNMRGLPDDFDGDLVTKSTYMKPNRTIGIDLGFGSDEFFGKNVKGLLKPFVGQNQGFGLGVQYNNYNGANISVSLNMKANFGGLNANLGLRSSSSGGLSISPSVSFERNVEKKKGTVKNSSTGETSIGLSFNTVGGLYSYSVSHSVSNKNNLVGKSQGSLGASINLVPNTYTPQIRNSYNNINISFGVKIEATMFGAKGGANIGAMYSSQWLSNNGEPVNYRAYGYLNSDKSSFGGNMMLDFNREKDAGFNDGTTNLPISNYTYDAYSIQGQGVSGGYRPYRSEVGSIYDNSSYSSTTSANANIDFASGNLADLGTDIKQNPSNSYSGIWTEDNEALNLFHFKSHNTNSFENNAYDLYEPYYYKQSGELAIDNDPLFRYISGDKPVQIELKRHGAWGVKALPKLKEKKSSGYVSHYDISDTNKLQRSKRVKRNQAISTLTKAEAQKVGIRKYVVSQAQSHHVSEVTVTKNDGSRYVYGIPVYNNKQKDVVFAISKRGELPKSNAETGLVKYTTDDNKVKNKNGKDEFFSSTELPPYAHSYLISEVLSSDYVDVNGNGADDLDYGSYTRFDYDHSLTNYKWRVPYAKDSANFDEGLKAEHQDEKASYVYGEKDICYLKKIETKTHVAIFHTSSRADAYETIDENGGKGTRSMKKLDKISLYAKGDWKANYFNNGDYSNLTPIKEVHFVYANASEELCKGIPNADNGRGKLTLKKVYFTYGNSHKAKWSSYEFKYEGLNPSYNLKSYNVWGGYKKNPKQPAGVALNNPFQLASSGVLTTAEYPYVEQNKTQEDAYSSAWSLTSIKLPSGGTIKINYESDDYAYVQNKRALEMVKIIGVSDSPQGQIKNRLYDSNNINYSYLLFNKPSGTDVQKYALPTGEKLYFRFLLDLDNKNHYDFVSGYCDVLSYGNRSSTVGYIKIKNVRINDKNPLSNEINPIAKAGWNYTRINLPKIAGNQPNNLPADDNSIQGVKNLAKALANAAMVRDIINMARGVNKRLRQEKYSKFFIENKSWVRLTNPNGHKLGGGSRVKKIEMIDEWNNMAISGVTSTYGQEYSYLSTSTINGNKISSGVATFEPLQSKANPFVQPIFMTTEHLLVPDDEHYIEKPLGVSFFPSPTITYARVEVKNLKPIGVNNNASGRVVHEFYTSKDYPTIVDNDLLSPERRSTFSKFSLVQGFTKDLMTASQGYVVINNDMNGKQKAQWVYAEGAENPISGVEYLYNLDATAPELTNNINDPFDKTTVNRRPGAFSNKCFLIHKDGSITSETVGIEYDAVADFRENTTENISMGFNAGLSTFLAGFIPGIVPSIWPTYSYSKTRFRSAVFTKVISKHGILREVVAHDLGSKVSTKNLAWDAETGEVLLTSVKNEYGDEIYTLNFPAHWAYDKMGMSSKNIGMETQINYLSEGTYYNAKASKYFVKGDELLLDGATKAWVLKVDNSAIYLIDAHGKPITTTGSFNAKVIRSGRRNQQALAIGSITLKKNPIEETYPGSGTYKNISDVISNINNEVLATSAIEYDDNWRTYAGANTEGDIVTECVCTPNQAAMDCFQQDLNDIFNVIFCGCYPKYYCKENSIFPNLDYTLFSINAIGGTNQMVMSHPQLNCPIILNFDNYIFDNNDLSFLSNNCSYANSPAHQLCGLNVFQPLSFVQKGCGQTVIATGGFLGNLPNFEGKIATFSIEFDQNCFSTFFDCQTIDVATSCISNDCQLSIGDTINPFVQAIKGIWRSKKSSLYLGERLQSNLAVYSNNPNASLNLREDGAYSLFNFFWQKNNNNVWVPNNQNWTWASQITNYSPIGQEVENQDALRRYSAAVFGYNHSLAIAVANNAQQNQIAFDGFEDYNYNNGLSCSNKKHFGFVCNQDQISEKQAHTGRFSMLVSGQTPTKTVNSFYSKHKLKDVLTPYQNTASSALPYVLRTQDVMNSFGPATVFHPEEIGYNKSEVEYVFSYWQKEMTTDNNVVDFSNIVPSIKIGGAEMLGMAHSKSKVIDGWQKVEYLFKIPNGSTGDIEIRFTNNVIGSVSFVDDIRIHPFSSNMKSYVYDPLSLRLMAELDENNYATFYEYDEEGKLLRIKKETERGILTIQESRSSSVKKQ